MRKLPKMILFDFGHTLVFEPKWDISAAYKALIDHAVNNPQHLTPTQLQEKVQPIFQQIIQNHWSHGYDHRAGDIYRPYFDFYGLKFDFPDEELETVMWDAASYGYPMPGVERMLDYLEKEGIGKAVISNYYWSSYTIKKRLEKMLPQYAFDFVIASSDYLYRKPETMFFNFGIAKTGLKPDELWYCGDRAVADVIGASKAGMFPVWYRNHANENFDPRYDLPEGEKPEVSYLEITQWSEMTDCLASLKRQL